MAVHLTRSDCWILRSNVYPVQWTRLIICCGMAVRRLGMLGVSIKKMEALTVKEMVTLIKRDKI